MSFVTYKERSILYTDKLLIIIISYINHDHYKQFTLYSNTKQPTNL
ncbi:hypothetical protein X975_01008, partial [Stegodyphus mimosarum]